MKKVVVFTGSGISADSGIATYRSEDGLWERYRIEDVCTPEALARNRATVIDFYNQRRRQLAEVAPNDGHKALVELEQYFDTEIVTQNIDNLHERAGSSKVTHLHGELTKLREESGEQYIVDIGVRDQRLDERAPNGELLRPHIVFFGESVPMFERAVEIIRKADILVVVGTSLAVYPAGSLVGYVRDSSVPIYVVDPADVKISFLRNPITHIKERAAEGVPKLVERLKNGELDNIKCH
ncbi:MAG: NAD-dependent deacylase [Alistipes sp.]|nr:NAD-dependent deacylase [Alistipes sp.]